MRLSSSWLAAFALLTFASAELHELIVGTFGTNYLYTLEFDDEALTLELVGNTSTTISSSWIVLSHDKQNLYGTDFSTKTPVFVSYTLDNASDIVFGNSVNGADNCTGNSAYVVAATEPPYAVYGAPYGGSGGCGEVMSVDENGILSETIQNYTYSNSSGVHGMALSPSNTFLYSADDSANTLWTHSVDSTTGELTLVSSIAGPSSGADPRHLAVHPSGQSLYVVLESANELAQYSIDNTTGIPAFYNVTYPLIPSGSNSSLYASDEVALSSSSTYLWATSRSSSFSGNSTGYITAFMLSSSGAITSQLFLVPTTTGGGAANSVAPSEFSDEFVALTDNSEGFVQVWRFDEGNGTASVVAQVNIDDGGCCANAVWYS